MKKRVLKATLASALSLALSVTPALAVADAGNSNTGPDSYNDASVSTSRVVIIENTNYSDVFNSVSSWVNSGNNSASYNTGNGEIDTGDASWGTELSTNANFNETDLTMDVAGDPSATNNNTGPDSDNDAYVDIDNTVTLDNDNDSFITNEMVVDVDSGDNEADYNTGSGNVNTGNAEGSGSVTTETNANQATVEGSASSEHSASNDTTGYSSDNDAYVDLDNSTVLNNWNGAELYNSFDVWVVSGENSASYNTGNGDVDTGDANAAGSGLVIDNKANGNFATIEGGVGETTGSASNSTTGAESTNDASVEVDNTVTFDNDNWGYIDNLVLASAISGWNTAGYNTGNASVETDTSSMGVGVGNILNANNASVGSDEPLASSGTAFNEYTGDDSFNEASVDTDNVLTVDNVNNEDPDGGVLNDIEADALSGYNSGSYNTGNSDIDTGESGVGVGLATDENSNVTFFAGFGANTDSMGNSYTGFLSTNWATVDHTDAVNVVADNWGWIANIFDDEANSGSNLADYNTGNSSTETDDASLSESTNDSMNYNYFGPAFP